MTPTDPAPDEDLVHVLDEKLREFRLRLGENTAGFIAAGRRVIELSGGERRDLARDLAVLVDELVERRRAGAAGPGHHVMVTVDEDRNNGRVSIARSMVPLWSPAGLLRAGDPVEVVREEFDLTEAEAAVIAALVEDFSDLDLGDENAPPPEEDVCRSETVTVDGQPETVRVRGREPMTDLDRSMFGELAAAARAWAAQDEHMAVRQELAAAWMRAAARIPEGPEKTRLRAAVKGAQAALDAHRDHRDGGEDVDIS